jgi:hypothetical protein
MIIPSMRPMMAIICIAILAGCQQSLPTAPSNLVTGIVVYQHANYLGESAHVKTDLGDLANIEGPCYKPSSGAPYGSGTYSWNDCISSIRVAPGWRATLYQDDGYRDDRLELSEDMPNLAETRGCSSRGFNDCVTSIRVFGPS